MKRIIITLVSVLFAITMFAEKPKQIESFDKLMEYLKAGQEVNVVLHYAKCQLISDNEIIDDVPDAIGGMKIDVWEYFAPMVVRNKKAFVVSSTSKLIEYPKGDGFVYNYVKIRLYDDNSVKITAKYIDSVSHEILMDESFYGKIATESNNEGIYLYVD